MNEQQDKAILLRSTLELEKDFSKRTSGPKGGGKLTQRERAHGTEACFGFNKVLLKSCLELSDYRLIVWRKKDLQILRELYSLAAFCKLVEIED